MENSVFAVIDTKAVMAHVYSGAITPVFNDEIIKEYDVVFYEVKMSKEDAYLVTGNIKHFPKKPFVVTPREMVELLEGKKKPENLSTFRL